MHIAEIPALGIFWIKVWLGHLASQALRSRITDETKKIKMCVYFPVQHLRSYIVLCRHDVRSPHLNLSTIASSVFSKMSNYPFKSDTYLIHSWKISQFPQFNDDFPVIRFTAKISFKPVTRGAYRGGTCICTKHCTLMPLSFMSERTNTHQGFLANVTH